MPRAQQLSPATAPTDAELPAVEPEAVYRLYRDLLEADQFGASSNDWTQLVDDWFVEAGFPSILYR